MEETSGVNDSSRIIQTDLNAKDGQDKCPKCGATDISLNPRTGLLRCNFCRYEFKPETVEELNTNISELNGNIMGSAAQDISTDSENVITLKCSSCGAEVVIDTAEATQARCHWCRSTLSINQQIPNGSVPDVVLPFKLTKAEAKAQIENFVGRRKFFAHPKFRQEFTTENIMGVYFPYMVVDINSHAFLLGKGEKQVRRYTRGSGENQRTYYDADLYTVGRDFDLAIDDLTIESNSDRLNKNASGKTNNIINSIMPFDTENCVKWNSNYLKGYTSERRDTNVEQLRPIVNAQAKDIAKFAANNTIKEYDRGVCWENQNFDVKGSLWKTAYLPVWLYSYQEDKGDKKLLHYVAVNARTKETMGSVPIHMPKLLGISALVELLGILLMMFVDSDYSFLFLLLGFIYFLVMYLKYRNTNARHHYETETKSNMQNLRKKDEFIKRETGLSNSKINGANNTSATAENITETLMNGINSINPFK